MPHDQIIIVSLFWNSKLWKKYHNPDLLTVCKIHSLSSAMSKLTLFYVVSKIKAEIHIFWTGVLTHLHLHLKRFKFILKD